MSKAGFAFTGFLTALLAAGLVTMLLGDWSRDARFFPLAILLPTLALALVQLRRDWNADRDAGQRVRPEDVFDLPSGDDDMPPEVYRARARRALAWVFGFLACSWLFGFLLSIPAFMLAYLRLEARARWLPALLLTVAPMVLLFGVLDLLINIHFPAGILVRWLVQP